MACETTVHAVKVGSRWTAVVEYCHHGGSGCRQGYWCSDQLGGWGVSDRGPDEAVAQTGEPVLFRSKRAALRAWSDAPEYCRGRTRDGRGCERLLGHAGACAA